MQKGKILTAIRKFARLRIILTCFALVFLGSVIGGAITEKTFLALLLIAVWIVHANSINDFADQDIDLVNLKQASDRPLISKDISFRQLWLIHLTSALLMLLLSFFFGFYGVWLSILILICDYLYSLRPFRLTDMTFVSPFLLALAYTYYSFSLGFWAAEGKNDYPALLVFGLFLAFTARILLKDFRDTKGDKKFGKITFLLRFGAKTTCLVSGLLWLLAVVFVGAAIHFIPGIMLVLIAGLFQIVYFLQILKETMDRQQQQKFILFIARAANIAIVVLIIYFFCQKEYQSVLQVIPVIVGSVLLGFNWFSYLNFKKHQAKK